MGNKLNLEKFVGEKFSPLSKHELSTFTGGRECATGESELLGVCYSADTSFYHDNGEYYGTKYHSSDKSCAPTC